MSIGITVRIHRTATATPATTISATLLTAAIGSTGLLAMTLLTEEGIGALATTTAAAVVATGLANAVRLTNFLLTVSRMALEPWLALTAAAAATIVATCLSFAVGLATTRLHTLILFAALTLGAGTARTATAIATTNLAIAVRNTGSTLPAIQRVDIGNTFIVPFSVTAPAILVANAFLHRWIVAAWVIVGSTAITRPRAGATITWAYLTRFATITGAVPANRVRLTTATAAQGSHFIHANPVPLNFAAEDILVADAGCYLVVITIGRRMSFATTCAPARAAVSRANQAILVVVTSIVAATTALAVTAVEGSNLPYAHFVPGVVAAEGVLLTDTGLNRGVLTARPLLDFTAGTGTATAATIVGTGVAGLPGRAHPITTVSTAHAFAATERLDFGGAGEVPAILAAPGVQTAHAGLDGSITTALLLMCRATIPASRAVAAIDRTDITAFINRTLTIPTASRIPTFTAAKLLDFPCANGIPIGLAAVGILLADTLGNSGVIAAWSSIIFAALTSACTAVSGTEEAVLAIPALPIAATWLVLADTATILLHLTDTGLIPTGVTTEGILPADTGHDSPIITTGRPIGLAAITGVITTPTVLRTT